MAPFTDVYSLWDQLVDDPAEAHDLRLRSQLMRELSREIRSWGVTYRKASVRTGISAPRVSDILNGKIDRFSLTFLIKLAYRMNIRVTLNVPAPADPPTC